MKRSWLNRKTPMKPAKGKPKRRTLRQASAKKRGWQAKYHTEKARRMTLTKLCEKCGQEPPRDGHHPFGQAGEWIMVFVLVCRGCHDWCHENGKAAKAAGWIVDTLKTGPQVMAAAVSRALAWWEHRKEVEA